MVLMGRRSRRRPSNLVVVSKTDWFHTNSTVLHTVHQFEINERKRKKCFHFYFLFRLTEEIWRHQGLWPSILHIIIILHLSRGMYSNQQMPVILSVINLYYIIKVSYIMLLTISLSTWSWRTWRLLVMRALPYKLDTPWNISWDSTRRDAIPAEAMKAFILARHSTCDRCKALNM